MSSAADRSAETGRAGRPSQCVVIGGGISGLTTAYRLSRLVHDAGITMTVTLLESAPRFGGVIETQRRDGFLLERGPDAFLTEKPWALDLCRELGLGDELIQTRPSGRRSFILRRGRLMDVPEGWYMLAPDRISGLLRMPVLSIGGKLRMACERFVPARHDGADESVGGFIRRRFGREALERVGQPMIGGMYTADVDRLSLDATLPRFREMEQRFGSILRALSVRAAETTSRAVEHARGPRYSLFASLRDGLGRLVESLVERMPSVDLRLASVVSRLEAGPRWRIRLQDGSSLEADVLCLAVPCDVAGQLLQPVAPGLASELAGIPYESVATVNLAFRKADVRRALEGFGFVVPAAERLPLIGCTFSSMKFAARSPEDAVLLRAFVGGATQPDILSLSDDALGQAVCGQLRGLLGIQAQPLLATVHRLPRAMPQYHVGHLNRIARIEGHVRRYPGLYLTGNGYRGIGIPDCIHQAELTAARMAAWMTRSQTS